jgi:hypothetical protein
LTEIQTGFQNRREFFRLKFATPLRFKSYTMKNAAATLAQADAAGTSRNLSQSGIQFQTDNTPPQLSSILWLNLDIRTLKICQEIEERVLVFNNGLLGRVVRVEEDAKTNGYDIGVCFLTQDQKNSREVQKILTEISKTA